MALVNPQKPEFCQACHMANRLERHHVKPRGAGGPDDDYNILKLCRVCHDRWHYRGYCDFFEEYPHVLDILEKRGWELVDMLW